MPAKHSPTRRVPSRRGATAPENPALRQLALKALAQRAGSAAGAAALAAAAQRAYDDLAQVSAPLIGQVGVDALTGRTLYLAQRKYPWLVAHARAGAMERAICSDRFLSGATGSCRRH